MSKNKALARKFKTIEKIKACDTIKVNGITLDVYDKQGKLKSVKELLVDGNEKIGKGIFHFSTLPGFIEVYLEKFNHTEKGTCFCNCSGCYGQSGRFKQYPVNQVLLAYRTLVARYFVDFFIAEINREIKAHKIKYIRIHATGDFFSREYALAWYEIIKANPQTIFWTYTKSFGYGFDDVLNAINALPNANIVESIINNCGFNFGHIDYLLDIYYKLQAAGEDPYICRCGIDKQQHCSNCKACSTHKYVLFIEHSTEYKAEKDPLYINIRDLINSQPSQEY